MPIELATQYLPYVDELFAAESKKSLLTNQDFTWDGAHAVKVYKIGTSPMNDYGRSGPATGNWSRYGAIQGLDSTTETMTLRKDRSFTFAIDKLDEDETKRQLQAAAALARQLREVVVPEVDAWTYQKMCESAGYKPDPVEVNGANIYGLIVQAGEALDEALAPDTNRFIIMTPKTYAYLKAAQSASGDLLNSAFLMQTDIGQEMRVRGAIAMIDGATIIRVPAPWLPANFGFLMAHPSATVAPTKLADYRVHQDPPGISGSLVEGRINYDAFVLENKAKALYYQAIA